MPIYHHFYIECRNPEGWVVPPDFKPERWTFECDHPFGEFAWAHPGRHWLALFFGKDPLFRMRPGPPEDQRRSPLLRHRAQFSDNRCNEDQLCWLPYPELVIDSWDTELVTVETRVPARYALLFGDGQQKFPETALVGAGASEEELKGLRDGLQAHEPVNATLGRLRYRIAELPPNRPVEVTWHTTIAEFIGEPHAALFKGLRQYGPDEDLRILSRRG